MRIVSLEPGATEILCAIGLGSAIVGVADDPSPIDIPDLAATIFVAHATREPGGRRVVELDEAALADMAPDLVVAGPRQRISPDLLPAGAQVLALDPVSLEGVFHAVATLGAMTASEDAALDLVEALREDLAAVEERVRERSRQGRSPVRCVALDGLDPLAAAGRWVPEQIRRAGGWDLLGEEGGPPRRLEAATLRDVDPEVLLVITAGLDLESAIDAWARARDADPVLAGLDALGDRAFVLDARGRFDLAGPRLVEGVALVAQLLDPGAFADLAPEDGWAGIG